MATNEFPIVNIGLNKFSSRAQAVIHMVIDDSKEVVQSEASKKRTETLTKDFQILFTEHNTVVKEYTVQVNELQKRLKDLEERYLVLDAEKKALQKTLDSLSSEVKKEIVQNSPIPKASLAKKMTTQKK
jgi:predicted RNase H-like nuclease (RuvC/YqgF family)